ncbi:CPBP family intramembrane glutamic endopeptidase [Balneola sp. MJW-20]|uniref:CPBP family intramembrane glutamic endopeptidase n=1 Tax=Gracilimonas aurantiaca TaxID=3234185 RepID=UPI003466C0E0
MSNQVNSYFKGTNSLLYSFLLSLPLFLLYEFLILISQPEGDAIVRISVDVWVKQLISSLGVNAISFSLLLLVMIGIVVVYKEKERLKDLRFAYFPLMLFESALYAIIVAILSQTIVSSVLNMDLQGSIQELSMTAKIALSLGAGLYEELFFRVILVSLLTLIFVRFFKNKWAGTIASVTLAALLFSSVHYIGALGDAFTLSSFLYRFVFGVILNVLYVSRGFGIAAWTHALYDIMVITFLNG